jgi:hypothetical protein
MSESAMARIRSVEEFLQEIGAYEFPHANGRTLYDHLVGTRDILRVWSQPEWVCDAGALHSVYGTDIYQKQLLTPARRVDVQAVAGARSERLAYLFGVIPRRLLFGQLEGYGQIPAEGLSLPCEVNGDEWTEQLDSDEVTSLLILHMANTAEQACQADGSPRLYLANLSHWGRLAGTVAAAVPPVFDSCRQTVSPEDESAALDAYDAGLAAMSCHHAVAVDQFTRAALKCPWVGEPAVWLAYLALQQGARAEAQSWIEKARTVCRQWGTAWDKRIGHEDWLALIDFVAREAEEPEIGPLPSPDPDGLPAFLKQLEKRSWVEVYLGAAPDDEQNDSGLDRFHRYVALFAEPDCASRMKVYPALRSRAWHDPQDFPLARALEAEYDTICREILALDQRQFAMESEPIPRSGSWNVLFFHERGRRNDEMCRRCPVTSQVIESHRSVRTLAGICYVSRLSPGTHVTAHYGPTNLRLRCHLGIRVPDGNCGIRVDGQTRQWQEGKCVVFDDFLLHEAWNHTAEERVVLIVDLWHPDLTDEEIVLIEGLHRYTVGHSASLTAYWAANEKARAVMDDRGSQSC